MDKSEKDNLYFIDETVYNCPFCKRRNVKYSVTDVTIYDDGAKRKIFVYQVKCSDCDKHSLHFTKSTLFPRGYSNSWSRFEYEGQLDDKFIAHRPAVLHILDADIPSKLKVLIAESEEARQSNLLTGASAALRKTIYQLLAQEEVLVQREATGLTDYRASIHELRDKYPRVDSELFNLLADVQELTSDLVHEDSWASWDAPQLRFLTGIVLEILEEIYAEPARRKRRKQDLDKLRAKLVADKKTKTEKP